MFEQKYSKINLVTLVGRKMKFQKKVLIYNLFKKIRQK